MRLNGYAINKEMLSQGTVGSKTPPCARAGSAPNVRQVGTRRGQRLFHGA